MKKLLRGHMPNTAVILAAGNGKRLGRLGKKLPKALLELDHKPIILHSIEKLRASGIDKINVVVNRKFQKEFEFLKSNSFELNIIVNDEFKIFGNAYSLILGTKELQNPFLIVDADIIYEHRSLAALAQIDDSDSILVSGFTNSQDEVWVCGKNQELISISKEINDLDTLVGEYIGISKVSINFLNFLKTKIDRSPDLLKKDYEYFLNEFAQSYLVKICYVKDLIWGEIDTVEHLKRITLEIYPAILNSEMK
jgi:choline kinase